MLHSVDVPRYSVDVDPHSVDVPRYSVDVDPHSVDVPAIPLMLTLIPLMLLLFR
ncbi:hypothetical protein [Lentibacillus cibarius]|uniref:hypothetical protein n=1 Tax=Lentibacillus cibarius TaxID=2583219 RepID=UPI0018F8C458|nr:hypothetical protein [Lentibacillus cibarius]